MKLVARILDIVAAAWIVIVGIVLTVLVPFFSDSTGEAFVDLAKGWMIMFALLAGPALVWVIYRVVASRMR